MKTKNKIKTWIPDQRHAGTTGGDTDLDSRSGPCGNDGEGAKYGNGGGGIDLDPGSSAYRDDGEGGYAALN